MSTVMLSNRISDTKQLQYEINWKVDEIASFLDMYLGDPKLEYLISAEYELKNLIDGVLNGRNPSDPPF